MRRVVLTMVAMSCLTLSSRAGDDAKDKEKAKDPLQGAWVGQTLESDGKAQPAEAAKRMRFKFEGDKLFIQGNFADDRIEECDLTFDAKKTPKEFDFVTPDGKSKVLGIYEIKNEELKLCMRHATSKAGRPTEFATKPESKLVLVVFKRKPEKPIE